MRFVRQIRETTTTQTTYPGPVTTQHVRFVYVPDENGADVYTEIVGKYSRSGPRRRRFLIERLTLTYVSTPEGGWRAQTPTITGQTVLANGAVSPRSKGFASMYRAEEIPADVASVIAHVNAMMGL